ncbi:hypothetical protein JIR23_06700 [Bradyrhizobium diazoefficiens]|nr:hypothetical protein JIR23_06700 [Bradyrhizobium diazoefficiens]
MARKRHKPEEIVAKLRQVDVLTAQASRLPRRCGRSLCGGLKSDQVKRQGFELESARLPWAVSDLTLDKLILAEAAGENSNPGPCRACIAKVRAELNVSERRAWQPRSHPARAARGPL